MSFPRDGDPTFEKLHAAAADAGYPLEAVMLVANAIADAADTVRGGKPSQSRPSLSAQVICTTLIETARRSYGERALDALEGWKLSESEDVGRIVTSLVKAAVIQAEPGDTEDDFANLYDSDDLMKALAHDGDDQTDVIESAKGRKLFNRKTTTLIPRLIERHFAPNAVQELVVTQRAWPFRVRVDLQRAIDRLLETVDIAHFSGVRTQFDHHGLQLQSLMSYNRHDNATTVAPMYEEVDIGEDAPARCLQHGLWLVRMGSERTIPAVVLMAAKEQFHQIGGLKFEIAVPRDDGAPEAVESFFRALEVAIQESRSYRGKVLSLEQADHYRGQSRGIHVHRLRTVARDQVILPRRTLTLLERNVINFVGQRERLGQLGMQVKKGLLFYGPPGTGKTHTIHYLAGALPGHTTLLITAQQAGLLNEYMMLARLLQPSIVVIEDADLIGRDRGQRHGPCDESLLNQLLNEMDGLREDAEVLFILTTNRPEMLEPALAARPGRIDQAIEFPMPDAEGREKLVRLYSRSARLDDVTIQSIVRKTEGVSGAFIKELMRRAAQFHIEQSQGDTLDMRDVNDALEEMLFSGGSLNQRLLGAQIEEPDRE